MSKKTKEKAKRKVLECPIDKGMRHSWCECTNASCGCNQRTCVLCGKKEEIQ